MLKKVFLFVLFSLLLFSCSDSGTSTVGLIPYNNNDISINIPKTWTVIKNTSKVLPKPKDGEIELAVSSPDIRYGFSNNLLILKQKLNKKISSREFSVINNVGASGNYVNYVLLDSRNITFANKDTSKLYIFEAKYNKLTPRLKFLQTSVVCGNKGYLLTIALSVDTKSVDKYINILNSFSCK